MGKCLFIQNRAKKLTGYKGDLNLCVCVCVSRPHLKRNLWAMRLGKQGVRLCPVQTHPSNTSLVHWWQLQENPVVFQGFWKGLESQSNWQLEATKRWEHQRHSTQSHWEVLSRCVKPGLPPVAIIHSRLYIFMAVLLLTRWSVFLTCGIFQ